MSQLPYYRLHGKVTGRTDISKGKNTVAPITGHERRSVYRFSQLVSTVGKLPRLRFRLRRPDEIRAGTSEMVYLVTCVCPRPLLPWRAFAFRAAAPMYKEVLLNIREGVRRLQYVVPLHARREMNDGEAPLK